MFTTSEGKLHPVWAFVISGVFSFAAFFISGVVAEAIAGERSLLLEVIFRALLAVLVFGLYVWLLAVADGIHQHRLASLGLPRVRGALRQFVIGCAAGFSLTVLAVVPIAVWGDLSLHLRMGWHILLRAGAVLFVLLVGALAEEMIFRGYPFQHLLEGIGAVGAIAVFAILFGAVHLSNPGASLWGLINTILIGVLLSIAYLRTRALWLPWGIHLGWNLTLGFLLGMPVSGLRIFNVVGRTDVTGPKWATGGGYGVEASVTGAVIALLGALIVWKLPVAQLQQPEVAPELAHQDTLPSI
ncbi:MAG: type II CAAX endopeptidase family protein [Acidobacteriota bacterium]|nr:type II CAAX endopeptidase family protein [Acidobacteriota bacterium]